MIKLWKLKTFELIFKRMFLTSKRRRQGEDRPHTIVDRCWEVSPRCIYERQYKFATAANPINYCSKVLALLPRIYIYVCNNVLFSLRGNYSTYIYIYTALPLQLYSNPKLVGQAWVSELSSDPYIYDPCFFSSIPNPFNLFRFISFSFCPQQSRKPGETNDDFSRTKRFYWKCRARRETSPR